MKKWIVILVILLTACKTQQINNQTTDYYLKVDGLELVLIHRM